MLLVLVQVAGSRTRPLNLRQFVPRAAELARQRQLSQRGPRHDISTLRTALRLGRQVRMHARFSPFHWTLQVHDLPSYCLLQADRSLGVMTLL